ncbi:MAG: 2OG-Fe(II) oxygenase [Proteobacteria bacterium]|nr:MAG: 2OG-Fe(II) oxygenase [Pseudomonadota bacterium]
MDQGNDEGNPIRGSQKVKPVQGTMVIFPAQITHPHEVLPTQSERYVLQTWVTDVKLRIYSDEGEY